MRHLDSPHIPHSMVASPDGHWLAAVPYPHGGGSLWNLTNPLPQALALPLQTRILAGFSKESTLALATETEIQFLPLPFIAGAPPPRRTIPCWGGLGLPGRFSFSPDGTMLAVTAGPAAISIYRTPHLEHLLTLESPWTPFGAQLAFSPDSRQLALCGGANRVALWEIERLRQELSRRGLGW